MTITMSPVLENKIIAIVPTPRLDGLIVSKDLAGAKPYEGSKQVYSMPNREGSLSYIELLNETERIEFEKLLALPTNSLSFYISTTEKRKESFWNKFQLELTRDGLILDLSKPMDNLKYRLAKVLTHLIAPSQAEATAVTQRYFIEEESKKNSIKADEGDLFADAWIKFGEVKNEPSKMVSILKIAGKQVSPDKYKDSDFLRAELSDLLKSQTVGKNSGLKEFLSIVNDENFDIKVLISDAVRAKALTIPVRKPEIQYELPDGERLGNISTTIAKLKDPEYHQVYLKLQAQVKTSQGK